MRDEELTITRLDGGFSVVYEPSAESYEKQAEMRRRYAVTDIGDLVELIGRIWPVKNDA